MNKPKRWVRAILECAVPLNVSPDAHGEEKLRAAIEVAEAGGFGPSSVRLVTFETVEEDRQ